MLDLPEIKLLRYIYEHFLDYGYPPTQREIAHAFNITRYKVLSLLESLASMDLITRERGISRGIKLTSRGKRFLTSEANDSKVSSPLIRIPIVGGTIVASEPVEVGDENFLSLDEHETIQISSKVVSESMKNLYAFRVNGDSMIDSQVLDGDIIIMYQKDFIEEGEMVAALVKGQGNTLKRFYTKGDKVVLKPSNQNMDPIVVNKDEIRIAGSVVMLIRQPNSIVEASDNESKEYRLDAAVPSHVVVMKPFVLAIAIRHPTSPILNEKELDNVDSTNIELLAPKSPFFTKMKLQISAPDCIVNGDTERFIRIYTNTEPTIRFHLTPTQTGKINIIVSAYQNQYWSGETQIDTLATEQLTGQVKLEIYSSSKWKYFGNIRKTLDTYFDLDELQTISFDLGLDFDNFSTKKSGFLRDLVSICKRNNRINDLLKVCAYMRPEASKLLEDLN